MVYKLKKDIKEYINVLKFMEVYLVFQLIKVINLTIFASL